jgi:hypothetical protein
MPIYEAETFPFALCQKLDRVHSFLAAPMRRRRSKQRLWLFVYNYARFSSEDVALSS